MRNAQTAQEIIATITTAAGFVPLQPGGALQAPVIVRGEWGGEFYRADIRTEQIRGEWFIVITVDDRAPMVTQYPRER